MILSPPYGSSNGPTASRCALVRATAVLVVRVPPAAADGWRFGLGDPALASPLVLAYFVRVNSFRPDIWLSNIKPKLPENKVNILLPERIAL